jgi:hypothetical protein
MSYWKNVLEYGMGHFDPENKGLARYSYLLGTTMRGEKRSRGK